MTYPITDQDMRSYNNMLLAHLPRGPMHEVMVVESQENPRRAFEGLVGYYAGDEKTREEIRAFFYAMNDGESWFEHGDGPTSGTLAERTGQIEIPQLPEDLVNLCRSKLMPIVQEHSTTPDVDAEEFVQCLDDLGIAGSLVEEVDFDEHGEDGIDEL